MPFDGIEDKGLAAAGRQIIKLIHDALKGVRVGQRILEANFRRRDVLQCVGVLAADDVVFANLEGCFYDGHDPYIGYQNYKVTDLGNSTGIFITVPDTSPDPSIRGDVMYSQRTPEWNLGLGMQYRFQVGARGAALTPRVDPRPKDSIFSLDRWRRLVQRRRHG